MSDPRPISELLDRLVSDLGPQNAMETARLFGAWDQIVGPDVSERCTPTSLKNGVLKIQADSAAWAREFRYIAGEVTRRINQRLGAEVVHKIEPWVPSSGARIDKIPGRSAPPDRGRATVSSPLARPSLGELKEADRIAGSIPDERLAEATKRALLAGKMRKKGG